MAGLEDLIRSSVPGGNIGKPLLIAALALLGSGALFGHGGAQRPASTGSQPGSDEGGGGLLGGAGAGGLLGGLGAGGLGAGGLLGGLGGLLGKLHQGGLGDAANSWVGSGENQPVSPHQLGSALGPDIVKALAQRSGLSEAEVTSQLSQLLPGLVDKLTPKGRLPTANELPQA